MLLEAMEKSGFPVVKRMEEEQRVICYLLDLFRFHVIDGEHQSFHHRENPRNSTVGYCPEGSSNGEMSIRYFLETTITGRARVWCGVNQFTPSSRTGHWQVGCREAPFGKDTYRDVESIYLAIDRVVVASFEEYNRQVEVENVYKLLLRGYVLPLQEVEVFKGFIKDLERKMGSCDYVKMNIRQAVVWQSYLKLYFENDKVVQNWSDETSDGLFL